MTNPHWEIQWLSLPNDYCERQTSSSLEVAENFVKELEREPGRNLCVRLYRVQQCLDDAGYPREKMYLIHCGSCHLKSAGDRGERCRSCGGYTGTEGVR